MELLLLCVLFFAIALIYSSVGLGGGSSYIAVLLMVGLSVGDIRFITLVCNIIVVSFSFSNSPRAGPFKHQKLPPLVVLSIPFAFLVGLISPEEGIYKIIAAVALIAAAITIFLMRGQKETDSTNYSPMVMPAVGGGIGMLSGFIGMGGGVFLSPVLHFIRWDRTKYISAAISFFILTNSAAGLSGQLISNPNIEVDSIVMLGLSVLVGGQIGNRLNIHFMNPRKIKIITAIVIGFVGCRILLIECF